MNGEGEYQKEADKSPSPGHVETRGAERAVHSAQTHLLGMLIEIIKAIAPYLNLDCQN